MTTLIGLILLLSTTQEASYKQGFRKAISKDKYHLTYHQGSTSINKEKFDLSTHEAQKANTRGINTQSTRLLPQNRIIPGLTGPMLLQATSPKKPSKNR